MTPPFKEFEIVRLRPEDRDPRAGQSRLWLMIYDKIREVAEIDISGLPGMPLGTMWETKVGGWVILTIPAMMSQGDDPLYMTEWFQNGVVDVTRQQASTTQAEAHANHFAKVQEITEDLVRLHSYRPEHLFALKFPYDPEMDEWIEEHTPSASLKDFGVFGQRIFVPDADEAFEFKLRWV